MIKEIQHQLFCYPFKNLIRNEDTNSNLIIF